MADIKLTKTSRDHCIKRIVERYNNFDDASAGVVVDRVFNALKNQTPLDWRFTTSPWARFFVLDQETKVKLLGISYRNAGSDLLAELELYCGKRPLPPGKSKGEYGIDAFMNNLDGFRRRYRDLLFDPVPSIAHDLKSAYPPGIEGVNHMEKLIAKGILGLTGQPEVMSPSGVASRPNVIVAPTGKDGGYCVWARQYGAWSLPNHDRPGTEYLYFEQLTPQGLDKSHRAVFRITPDGEATRLATPTCPHEAALCLFKAPRGQDCIPPNLRSESYWTLPVLLDRCYYDLDYSLTHFDTSWYIPNTVDLTLFRMLEAVIRSGGRRATEY
jgi:hypothetical protein